MSLKTPILLITFNRPDHTRQVLQRILEANPQDLYVFQDGAREGNANDTIKCAEVRQVINELVSHYNQYSSSLLTLHSYLSEMNLGCGPGPYEAITWFFSQVEYGIILEDDINPHPLFWNYIEELLVRYKDDNRIGMVCGHNLQRRYCGDKSYYFTFAMEGTLGWGTWRRVWKNFKFDIPYDCKQFEETVRMQYGYTSLMAKQESNNYKRWLGTDRHDCWDYQFDYYLLLNGYLNARANSCLTSHEGDESDATHSGFTNPNYKMEVNEPLFEKISHPTKVSIAKEEKWRIYKRTAKLLFLKMLGR